MPSISENLHFWNGFDWPRHGEEWSKPFGNSETQWWFMVMPRIHRWLPAKTILEVGVGHGRWTQFLIGNCDQLTAVDLSQACVDYCRQVFGEDERRRFVVNDGMSLLGVPDASVDLIFSFDSLIHTEVDAFASYLLEFRRVLKPGGAGFIHHSNLGQYPGRLAVYDGIRRMTPAQWWQPGAGKVSLPQKALQVALSLNTAGWRAPSMSAARFVEMAHAAGLTMVAQETINWGFGRCMIDCLSTFRSGVADTGMALRANHSFGRPRSRFVQLAELYCKEDRK
jgi:SAM-dependent methyltransferase